MVVYPASRVKAYKLSTSYYKAISEFKTALSDISGFYLLIRPRIILLLADNN